MDTNHTITQWIIHETQGTGDIPCLSFFSPNLTTYCYQQLFDRVAELKCELEAYQLQPGDRVALIADAQFDSIAVLLALLDLRCTVAMIDPHLPKDESAHQLALADVVLVVKECHGHLSFDKLALNESQRMDRDPNIALMLFTSGTSGQSKAVMLSHANFLYLMQHYKKLTKLSEGKRVLSVLPIFHVASLVTSVFVPLCSGAEAILINDVTPRRLRCVFEGREPDCLCAVPRLFEVFVSKIKSEITKQSALKQRAFKFLFSFSFYMRRCFRINIGRYLFLAIHHRFGKRAVRFMSGSAALLKNEYDFLYGLGFFIQEAYGLTETTGPVCISALSNRYQYGASGKALHGSSFSIVNGEITYQGPALMQGYFRNKSASQDAINSGILYTGDLGQLACKNLLVQGRKKTLMVFPDGKKAQPEMIEQYYQDVEGVDDVAVSFNPFNSKDLVLVVSLKDEENRQKVTDSLYRIADGLHSPYRINSVVVVDALPKTNTHKIKRHALHELLKTCIKQEASLQQVLQLSELDHQAHFSELGIDSLKAAEFTQQINDAYGKNLSPTIFWQYHTFAEIERELLHAKPKQELQRHSVTNQKAQVAIIAMSGRFPGGANDVDTFWQHLLEGRNAMVDVPKDRWDIDAYYDPDVLAPGKMCARKMGVIDDIMAFDHKAFSMKPRQVKMVDPQQRLMLMEVKSLLAKTQYGADGFRDTQTGVFVGASANDYLMQTTKSITDAKVNAYLGTGLANSAIAGRVAYYFDLHGPTMTIDTACSSSLTAFHLARRAIEVGDCDQAIVGGVNEILEPMLSIAFSKAGMLSPDSACKTFSNEANGYARSEGVACVLLKRLDQALADGDDVLAVVSGSCVNQDGLSNGLTAPNAKAQKQCMQKALVESQLTVDDIGFVEAHGTGTPLGDPIELDSIQRVYASARTTPLYIGAVKSNIGHGEAFAGMASLIKAILVLNNKHIPANIHFNTLNANASLVGQVLLPMKSESCDINHVGVCAYSFTGTNAHIILSDLIKT